MVQHSWLVIPFFLFFSLNYTAAYTWQFTSQPGQCQNVSVAVQGSGQPPYSLLLIPSGPTPLPNNTEVRNIQNIPFTGNSTSLSFNLNYPANSSFVAVVSDSSGFGTGGTSTPVTVLQSSDSSCYNPTQGIQLPFLFFADPSGGITQCESVRWWWQQNSVRGTVNFYGVIPGGDAFNIPQSSLSTNNSTGTGFSWTVDITGGTDILIIGGDGRGIGTGGAAPFTVAYSANNTCMSGTSPSSTAGSPAGGSYPTSTGNWSNNQSGKHSNTGIIAGGVAGGLALMVAVALLAFFYPRRPGYAAISKERPVNVLIDDEDDNGPHQDLPHYYAPQPYLVSDPNIGGTSGAPSTPVIQHPHGMSAAATTMHKSALPDQMRSVNIIQHDDAGSSEVPSGASEPETIELPPAYTNIRSAQRNPSIAPTTGSTTHTGTATP
ncbi:hypothetical protein EI94DRAFT_1725804 [Lactarius quietus]|nr:hypothetical protein EI94DRAFT_1725804 [Lactarius quietus]